MVSAVQARTFLGLCQVSMGEIQLGASNYERVLKQDPDNLEACVYLAQARKEVILASRSAPCTCLTGSKRGNRVRALITSLGK